MAIFAVIIFNSIIFKLLSYSVALYYKNPKKKFSIFYRIILLVLVVAGLSSCKSHKKVNKYDDVYLGTTIETPVKKKKATNNGALRDRIAEESLTWIGTPYGYGKNEKGVATDCSGMVISVYELIAEIKLPRNSAEQADFCESLKEKDVDTGDLVFFATGSDKKKVSHVGIMLNKDEFVHASGSKGVIISEMTTPYYQRTFIKYGRVPGL